MIEELFAIIEDRKAAMPPGSYTAQLSAAGDGLMLKKVGDVAIELSLAAASEENPLLMEEAAELIHHLQVLSTGHGLGVEEVQAEVRRHRQPKDLADQ